MEVEEDGLTQRLVRNVSEMLSGSREIEEEICFNSTDSNNGTDISDGGVFSDIPPKEVIIVLLMLALWLYSIALTRKAWYRILKE